MLKRCILAENRKLHASPIWAMFFALPILSATYGTLNYLQNLEVSRRSGESRLPTRPMASMTSSQGMA